MGFRGSNGTSHKTIKRKGRRTLSAHKVDKKTYNCPECRNQNDEPLFNESGKPFCSNCLVKINKFVIMRKRNVYSRK